jgi:hypothetical protein
MSDDDYGTILLRPLRGEPAGRSAVDVPKAMREGRRMRNRRWRMAGSGLLAAVAGALLGGSLLLAPAGHDNPRPNPNLPPGPAVPASCALVRLAKGNHERVDMHGGDASGEWHVGAADPLDHKKSALMIYRGNDLVVDRKVPSGGMSFYDINSSGVAVGSRFASRHLPYAYRDGEFIPLQGLGEAVAINDSGTIVGQLEKTDGKTHPVRWRSVDAKPEWLPEPDAAQLQSVYDLTEDGMIMAVYQERNTYGGYLWMPDGSLRRLSPPADPSLGAVFTPIGFHYGWLYGMFDNTSPGATLSQPPPMPDAGFYRYEPRSGTWQKVTGLATEAQVAVGAPGARQQGVSNDPTVFVGPRTMRLPVLEESGGTRLHAFQLTTISEDGRVVAGSAQPGTEDFSRAFQPVLWRCE